MSCGLFDAFVCCVWTHILSAMQVCRNAAHLSSNFSLCCAVMRSWCKNHLLCHRFYRLALRSMRWTTLALARKAPLCMQAILATTSTSSRWAAGKEWIPHQPHRCSESRMIILLFLFNNSAYAVWNKSTIVPVPKQHVLKAYMKCGWKD